MNRRTFLLSALALTSCQSSPQTPLTTDATLVAGGSAAVRAVLDAQPGLPAADLAAIDTADDVVQTANKVLQANASAGNAQALVASVRALAPVALRLLPVGATERAYVNAAVALLPTILALAGVAGGTAERHAGVMSAEEARAILRGAKR